MTATTRTAPAMLATLLALLQCYLTGCAEPCRPRVVQVSPELGMVRISNDCAGPIDLAPVVLCHGSEKYGSCVSIAQAEAVPAGACIDAKIKMPAAPAGAFGVALFNKDENPVTGAPIDVAIWGTEKTLHDEHGLVAEPAVAEIDAAHALTRGECGWYLAESRAEMSPCATWGHVITAEKVCVPQLVEVHPGPAPYFKVSMPPECPAAQLGDYSVAWGGLNLQHALPLPERLLVGGDCVVVGDPVSSVLNGFAQWDWSHLEPLQISATAPVPTGADGVGLAAVSHGGKMTSGVLYSGQIGKLPTWPALGKHVGGVPAGQSLRWTGAAWEVAPPAANQCPRWDVEASI